MSYIEIVIKPNFEKACEALEQGEMHKDAIVALNCLKEMWSKPVTINHLLWMMEYHKHINARNYNGDYLWGQYIYTLGYYIQANQKILKQKKRSLRINRMLRYHHFRLKLNIIFKKHHRKIYGGGLQLLLGDDDGEDFAEYFNNRRDKASETRKYYERIKKAKKKKFRKK